MSTSSGNSIRSNSRLSMGRESRQRLAKMPDVFPHSFSARELTSLGVICDTLLPLMPGHGAASLTLIQQLPNWVAGLMSKRLKPDKLQQLRLVLWLLGSPLGSFLLFGFWVCSWSFPWIHSFHSLPSNRREAALLSWATSRFLAFRSLFKGFKAYCCCLYATVLDSQMRNVVQEALNYHPPSQPLQLEPSAALSAPLQTRLSGGSDCSESFEGTSAVVQPVGTPEEGYLDAQEEQGQGGPLPVLRAAVVDAGLPAGRFREEMQLRGFWCFRGTKEKAEEMKAAGVALPEVSPESMGQVTVVECDAVVVGSGCGGSVIAAQLSEARPGSRVLVLEKGRYYAGEEFSQLENPSMNELYENGGFLATSDGSLSVVTGTSVGGGSVINWGASFRTPQHVKREWAQLFGLKAFDTAEYDQAMDAVCQRLRVNADNTEHNLSNSVLREGCTALGYPCDPIPRNAPPPHACGFCHFGCREGGKQSTAVTWLQDAVQNGAVIVSSARAERVLLGYASQGNATRTSGVERKKKAFGVLAVSDTGTNEAPAKRILVQAPLVIVACGSLWTPGLLLRSGLSNPNIGTHLRLHPVSTAWGYFPEDDPMLREKFPQRNPEGGIMTLFSGVVGNWSTTGYGALIQTPTTHPGMFAASLPWFGKERFEEQLLRFTKTALLIVITRDTGRGRVYLDKNKDITFDYDLNRKDTQSLQDGLRACLHILRAAGAHELGTTHQGRELAFDCTKPHTERDFEQFLRRVDEAGVAKNDCPLFSAHQLGSCPMGVSPATSATDENAECWEASGLFLGDASVLPSPSGVNPMVTIESVSYLIGSRLAKRFATAEFSPDVAPRRARAQPKM